jgi:hypothetical protein
MNTPTLSIYQALEQAFEYFNRTLFSSCLPLCLFTLRSSRYTYGYMHKRRFVSIDGVEVDELALNPGYFAIRSAEEVLSTLVHEMAHHWQNHFGAQVTTSPHNREWAEKMRLLGLMPSHTGVPGGRQTGQRMSHYILPDGTFARASTEFCLTGWSLPWLDSHVGLAPETMQGLREQLASTGLAFIGGDPPLATALARGISLLLTEPAVSQTLRRVRYVCPQCGIRAWAAPDTALECGECGESLENSPASLPSLPGACTPSILAT